jgi:hypothetical protein
MSLRAPKIESQDVSFTIINTSDLANVFSKEELELAFQGTMRDKIV